MRIVLTFLFFLLAGHATAANRLAQESSPYLQQHADNPVDWYPWGDEALDKARAENKMIFLSVGYASCHWCHVMEEESFENEAIADFLNRHFVSIKIDRERRPDLDEQFILVTTAMTGSAGWPNTVFLTPEGAPFHAGTYFPPDLFQQLLDQIVSVWKTDNVTLRAQADDIAARLSAYLDKKAVLGSVSSADINAMATAMLTRLDDFNGGFGTSPKFPQENVLLFLMDQAERSGDSNLLGAVTLTLDGMVRGGIHDHVGGGFHRYGTDPEWNIPHFEKMLYNQALIGRVLLRGYSATGNADFARAATRIFDYVLRDMQDAGGGFYAAEDADSLDSSGAREEGAFYVWTPAEIDAALGDMAATVIDRFNVDETGPFEGSNILYLTDLPSNAGINDSALETLRLARAERPAPIKDKKIILAWNGEMIVTLAEAALVLDRPDYGDAAIRAARFSLREMQRGDGLKRIWYQGRADTAAQLTDYAALGRALLALEDYLGGQGDNWLAVADGLAGEMITLFGDDDRAMRMNADAVGLGPSRPIDDSEIASGNAQALDLLAGLDRRLARIGDAAPNLAGALALDAIQSPGQRAATLTALEVQRHGMTGPMRVSNGGAVRVVARADRQARELVLQVTLRPGWHINAHEPLEDYLIGMVARIDEVALDKTAYPTPQIRELGFSQTPLALYEQDFTLRLPMTSSTAPHQARLTLQACSDQVCLPPDDMTFWFW